MEFIHRQYKVGNQSEISEDAKKNKARNTYFFLPFLLGLIGLIFLYHQDPKRFWVLLLFFLFTGLALKIYLNERPFEPRERIMLWSSPFMYLLYG